EICGRSPGSPRAGPSRPSAPAPSCPYRPSAWPVARGPPPPPLPRPGGICGLSLGVPSKSQLQAFEDLLVQGELLGLREGPDLVRRKIAQQIVNVFHHDFEFVPEAQQLLLLLHEFVPLVHEPLHLFLELDHPTLQLSDLGVRADRDRGLLLRRGPPSARFLFQFPAFALEVHLPPAQGMMPFVEEAPFVAQQLLPLLELPLPFVDPIHDGAELVLLADDVRLPFLELTEGLLAGLQLPSERVDPTPQRVLASLQLVLLQPQDVPVCVLHVHEALFELQDVLLLLEEFLDLPLEFVPLPDLER